MLNFEQKDQELCVPELRGRLRRPCVSHKSGNWYLVLRYSQARLDNGASSAFVSTLSLSAWSTNRTILCAEVQTCPVSEHIATQTQGLPTGFMKDNSTIHACMTPAKSDAHRSMAVISSKTYRLGKTGDGRVTSGRVSWFFLPMLGTADSLGKKYAYSLVQ